jgi:hypothetical protein
MFLELMMTIFNQHTHNAHLVFKKAVGNEYDQLGQMIKEKVLLGTTSYRVRKKLELV